MISASTSLNSTSAPAATKMVDKPPASTAHTLDQHPASFQGRLATKMGVGDLDRGKYPQHRVWSWRTGSAGLELSVWMVYSRQCLPWNSVRNWNILQS